MNPTQTLAPWLAPLGWLALEATVVILAALALQPLLRTAAARRTLWRAALLALVAVLAAELTGTGSQLPAQLRLAWQTTFPQPAPPLLTSSSTPELSFTPAPVLPLAPIGGEGRAEGAFTAPEPLQFEPAASLPPSPRSLSHSPTFSPAPVLFWLTGIVALLARSAWTHAGFAWLRLRHFIPAAEALRERVAALAARLGLRRRVRVLASERLRTPAAFGWLRPGVVVPGDFTARFAPAQQDVMLAHELAHLAARDPLWQLLADLAAAALWWHPLVWVARRQHRLAGELAADDASLALPDGPVVLAECLLALGHEAADCPRAALGMAGFRSQLGRRVARLVALPPGDWQPSGKLRSFAQTTTALVLLAALALLPGCAANRTATEAPTRTVAKWWQAKKAPVGDDLRSLTSTDSGQRTAVSKKLPTSLPTNDQPVFIQGRVRFSGTPPAEHNIPLPPAVLAARTNAPMKTRFHLRSFDGGLADVLVYVKSGLEGQTYSAPTNAHVIRVTGFEFQPYISAVEAGQPIRWENHQSEAITLHPTPTNFPNKEFSRMLLPDRPTESDFLTPEMFVRVKTDAQPWMFHYVSVFDHPFYAVTDAEGHFRFPRPLPPGKYTLAAVHRRAGESTQEINLRQPLPAGQPLDVQFQLVAKEVSVAVPAIPGPFTNRTAKSLNLRSYTPSAPLPRAELLERKARVEAEIKEAEKTFPPTHPKMLGLRKQLESVEEALTQLRRAPQELAFVRMQLAQFDSVGTRLQSPDFSTSERLLLLASCSDMMLGTASPRGTNTWEDLERQKLSLERTIQEQLRTYPAGHLKMKELFSQQEALEVALVAELKQALARFETVKQDLIRREEQLSRLMGESQTKPPAPAKPGASLPAPVGADVRRLTSPQTPPVSERLVTSSHTIAPGDSLRLLVAEDASYDAIYLVRSDGNIMLPRVGKVAVGGKRLDEAQGAVKALLEATQLRTATVTLTFASKVVVTIPATPPPFTIHFAGEFLTPGPLVLPPDVRPTLLNAITRSGGITPNGDLTRVKLLRIKNGQGNVEEVNVASLLADKAKGDATLLQSGDIILVPTRPPVVYVTGSVDKPGLQPLAKDEKLTAYAAILRAGGFAPGASLTNCYIVRVAGNGEKARLPFNVKEVQKDAAKDIILQGGDTVVVPASSPVLPPAPKPGASAPATSPFAANPSPQPSPLAPQRERESALPAPVGADVRRLTSPQTPNAIPQTPPVSERLVTPSPTVVKPVAASSLGAGKILRKLDEIVLPEVHFDGVPLAEVMKRLSDDATKFDPERKGLNFLINDVAQPVSLLDANGNPVPVAQPLALSEGLIRISTTMRNLTLRQVLDVICKTAELPTQYSVEEYAIVFIPRGPGNAAYFSRIFKVNADTFLQDLQGVVGNPVLGVGVGQGNSTVGAGASTGPVRAAVPATVPATKRTAAEANTLVRQFFQSAGVTSLGVTNSSTRVFFNPENGLLIARGTTNDLRVIEQAIEKVQPSSAPTPSGPESRAPERDRPGRSGPVSTNAAPRSALPTPIYKTNNAAPFPTHSSKAAQRINAKLDEIILPEVRFDSVVLPEVVKWLDEAAKKSDPDPDVAEKGLHFLINNVMSDYIAANVPAGSPPSAVRAPIPQVLDPVTGQLLPAAVMRRQMPDLENALVKVTTTLTNLTLRQTLDVICKTAEVKLPDGRPAGLKYSIEEYAIVFTTKLPEQPTLFSRMFKVDPDRFARGLRSIELPSNPTNTAAFNSHGPVPGKAAGRPAQGSVSGVVGTNQTDEFNILLRDYFRAAGVANLGPTNSPDATQVFFNDRNGLLLVRASLQDLDIIQMAIELLNVEPPQVKFAVRVFASEAKYVKPPELIPRGPSRGFFAVEPPVASVKSLSAEEAQEAMKTLGLTARSLPVSEVLILSGQQAEFQILDPRVPPAPKASATSNTSPAAAGVTIQLLPTAGPHGEVQASLIVSQSSPMESKGITNALPNTVAKDIYDLVPVPGRPIPTLPSFRLHQSVQQVSIPAGHSALVTIHPETSGKRPNGQPATEFKVFLTPTLIEPAGHRVHTDAEMPFIPAAPAKK